eukprot:scaffold170996_cov43-Prasinocladus_malaysianus.AAC.1
MVEDTKPEVATAEEPNYEEDPEYARRCEQVAVQEWYINERKAFEERALEALDVYKKVRSWHYSSS